MAKKAKIVKRVVKRRAPKQQSNGAPPEFLSAVTALANREPQRHEESADSRAGVLGALAEVFLSQNAAITAIAEASVQAPSYMDTLRRG